MVPGPQLALAEKLFGAFVVFIVTFAATTGHPLLAVLSAGVGLLGWAIIALHKRRPDNPVLAFLRAWYQPLTYTYFYEITDHLNRHLIPVFLDGPFQRLELAIFGFQPALTMREAFPHPLIADLMYFSYFTYYALIPILGFTLWFRDREQFGGLILRTSAVFYLCYAIYAVLPVMGPRIWNIPHPDGLVVDHVMAFIYRLGEIDGSAMPSSHVAVALAVTLYAARVRPKLFRYFYFPDIILLSISTVYCGYHYAIDVVAGFITTLMVLTMIRLREHHRRDTSA